MKQPQANAGGGEQPIETPPPASVERASEEPAAAPMLPPPELPGGLRERLPQQAPLGVLTTSEARVAVTAALNQAAQFTFQLEVLVGRLSPLARHRGAVENARRLVGDGYNALAAAAGLLGLER